MFPEKNAISFATSAIHREKLAVWNAGEMASKQTDRKAGSRPAPLLPEGLSGHPAAARRPPAGPTAMSLF